MHVGPASTPAGFARLPGCAASLCALIRLDGVRLVRLHWLLPLCPRSAAQAARRKHRTNARRSRAGFPLRGGSSRWAGAEREGPSAGRLRLGLEGLQDRSPSALQGDRGALEGGVRPSSADAVRVVLERADRGGVAGAGAPRDHARWQTARRQGLVPRHRAADPARPLGAALAAARRAPAVSDIARGTKPRPATGHARGEKTTRTSARPSS